ncbi:hypothetical protein P8935_21045 [Telmatobacter sp. DSM 110680]|uniref:Glycosyltransferase RgtA/B/C/D-like domain-containing protein n=1 Tax=Telmatobacter sp. DSM 110680 TaxID=3036704 RepID=A0AAU7DI80_9BACT
MTEQPIRRPISRNEWLMVVASSVAASALASVWSWRHSAMLNYGDAVAHMHIARRVFDSHRPGLSQLGSVWLPLPHLLILPFVTVYAWWANGIAGMIPSALAYVAGCAGVYRLARHWLRPSAAVVALAFYGLNANLLYLQTTAMTEPLFLCEMVWLAVWLVEWRAALNNDPPRAARLLRAIALVLVAAVFTRYDGWILAALAWTSIGIVQLRTSTLRSRTFWIASAAVVAAPLIWFTYNAVVFGDWLDFARGPYSAAAIELRTSSPGSGPPHPGWHNPWVSLLFFVKCAEMDVAPEAWGNFMLGIAALGTAWGWITTHRRGFLWSLLLWLPIPFYAYSVSFGSVPIFLPVWWPHSWYNTRYGMEMLPALALALSFVAQFVIAVAGEFKKNLTRIAAGALYAVIAITAWVVLRSDPLTYIEGTKNIQSRRIFETEIPPVLRALLATRPSGLVLMQTSVYPNLVAFSGIPLRQTLNESDMNYFTDALASPATHAAIVVAFDGDAIDKAVKAHPEGLTMVRRFDAPEQKSGTVYVSDTSAGSKAAER